MGNPDTTHHNVHSPESQWRPWLAVLGGGSGTRMRVRRQSWRGGEWRTSHPSMIFDDLIKEPGRPCLTDACTV